MLGRDVGGMPHPDKEFTEVLALDLEPVLHPRHRKDVEPGRNAYEHAHYGRPLVGRYHLPDAPDLVAKASAALFLLELVDMPFSRIEVVDHRHQHYRGYDRVNEGVADKYISRGRVPGVIRDELGYRVVEPRRYGHVKAHPRGNGRLCSMGAVYPRLRRKFLERPAQVHEYRLAEAEPEDDRDEGSSVTFAYLVERPRRAAPGKHHTQAEDHTGNQHMDAERRRVERAHVD